MPVLHTFGDSILDCAHYNADGIEPAGLVARELGIPAARHAVDGATVASLPRQARGVEVAPHDVVTVTVGGNDLLSGLIADQGPGISAFGDQLAAFLATLPRGRVLLGNVYDPTFGDDAQNFLPVPPEVGRAALARMNAHLASLAARHGRLVDVHGHFLRGDPSWFTSVIEPSGIGAREVARAFLPHARALAAPSA